MRKILHSKIHRATVTDSNLDYIGSITIDRKLINESGIAIYEEVHVVDVTNGARFHTYVIPAEEDSGIIQINGAAAHLVNKGDVIIIMAYQYLHNSDIEKVEPKVIFVDKNNKIISKEIQTEMLPKFIK